MAYRGPSIQTHLEWLGLVQPVGLVVAPVVLNEKELYPESQVTTLADGQRRLADLLEERELESGHKAVSVGSFERFATEILEWSNSDIKPASEHPTPIEVVLEEYGEVLKPSHVVAGAGPDNKHDVLVQELPAGTAMDELLKGDGHGWEASPHHRFERLLKESEHPIGLLFNGVALRLIFAPRGESSGYITFPLEPMTTVAGRPMLGALQMLLGVDRMFSGSSDQRLPELLNESRKRQNDVSTRLAEQVLEALWELLLGFDEAERNAQNKGTTVLGDLPKQDPDHIYGGLITVLLRLVFLLYAEDEDLMPPDSLYGQHYSVSGLAIRLRQEADEHKGGMASRRGAWASLLSLFRLVYDGGGATEAYLPARHGELFDPDAYPFLEGRSEELGYEAGILENLPTISDDVVEKVLSKLLWLDGERLSYRALDVEQIGSVYEGIMGFRVEQAQGTSVGITHRPPRQKITISVVVNAEELLEQPASKREKWLDDQAGVKLKLPAAVKKELKSAFNMEEVLEALGKRLSPHTPRGLNPGSLVLQPTAERRRSGSHYTPRSLTEPIVKEAFRPWLERNDHKPTAEAILDLKVCDPAMGSGAFLVATCRYLAGLLVEAWERDGFPSDFEEAWDKDIYARRLVAQRCLYGVDKNPFAVNLARLSLWLVTLSKELPFTFVDHALKCGDSLVGVSRKEIESALKTATKQRSLHDITIQKAQEQEAESYALFQADSRSDADDARKRKAWKQLQKKTAYLNTVGDLLVAAFFNGKKDRDRQKLRELYLAATLEFNSVEELEEAMEEPLERLRSSKKGIQPFHWENRFADVFSPERKGFDVVIGNPPFAGKITTAEAYPDNIQDWFKSIHTGSQGNADLSAQFLRRASNLANNLGSISLITTNTIAQGDTRHTGLYWLCTNGNSIYSAIKKMKWPGLAAVTISIIHITKSRQTIQKFLNGITVKNITAFLLDRGGNEDPLKLNKRESQYFVGTIIWGIGFTFEDTPKSDESTPGSPIPIKTKDRLIKSNSSYKEIIKPYIGGEEVNTSPTHSYHRYVANFGNRSEEECRKRWPELMSIIERKVKPERDKVKNKSCQKFWWKYPSLGKNREAAIEKNSSVLFHSYVSKYMVFAKLNKGIIYAGPHYVFPVSNNNLFSLLQGRIHEVWAHRFSATLEDRLRYTPTDCFETFPSPPRPREIFEKEVATEKIKQMNEAGTSLLHHRQKYMHENNLGLTKTYNEYHDPKTISEGIQTLRELHRILDKKTAIAYGWEDLTDSMVPGYKAVDLEIDEELSEKLGLPISSSDLFFHSAEEAINFESKLANASGKVKTKINWRYAWDERVEDEVISRLLELNKKEHELQTL